MPKYRLSISSNNETKEIEWGRLLEKEQFELSHDLLGIDRFTTRFEDSDDLKKFLYEKGIITNVKGRLSIQYQYKGEDVPVRYGISYEKDRKFLNPFNIIEYVLDRIDEKDIEFIQKLINKYDNKPTHANDIIILRNYIEKIVNNRVTERDTEYLKKVMIRFVNKESYKYDNVNRRNAIDSEGKAILAYKSLRELGIFCSNYYYSVLEVEEKEVTKVKKIGKKEFPGQLSFID